MRNKENVKRFVSEAARKNSLELLGLYEELLRFGEESSPRGLRVKELLNLSLTFDPLYPMTSFRARKFNLDYAKKETLWYLRGDRFDLSICDHAGAWNTLIQPDGGINSNYGQVIFEGPKLFDWVVEELIRDKNSRRAVIALGDASMLKADNTDHRCTMYISYCIRNNYLHQTVHMRSNDAIFGVTNDVFFYCLLHQMVWATLLKWYPDLFIGFYFHITNSMHVYERHFRMLDKLVAEGEQGFYEIPFTPLTNGGEVNFLRGDQDKTAVPENFVFSKWLLTKGA